MAGMRVVVVACDDDGNVDLDDLRAKLDEHAATRRRADGHLPVDPRRVRGGDRRDLRPRARRRRAGVPRRRQPQRHGRPGPAGPLRRRRLPPQPAQDVLHPPRRRRSRRRARGGAGPPGAVPANHPLVADGRPGRHGPGPDLGRAVGVGRHPADPVGLHPDDGRRRAAPGHRGRDPQRQLHRPPAAPTTTRCSTRAGAGWSPTSASSTCGRSPRRPASPSTTSPSGSSTTASTPRR